MSVDRADRAFFFLPYAVYNKPPHCLTLTVAVFWFCSARGGRSCVCSKPPLVELVVEDDGAPGPSRLRRRHLARRGRGVGGGAAIAAALLLPRRPARSATTAKKGCCLAFECRISRETDRRNQQQKRAAGTAFGGSGRHVFRGGRGRRRRRGPVINSESRKLLLNFTRAPFQATLQTQSREMQGCE